ncbi:MAG: UDP-N-acetylglucosamine--N-acetylmuramyl-(pentapeptide) pyrophosphoryl-undecaprenol N-acetylglucosamine transferase [Firmicutes bacterium]|nr:UDP-N-acetylglucosamine--N-acetylmuramyl-(pentapeptide) pyrophosphoryl-undecaprenol N-acetylglucosamine transferase [Bacillota bacterium]
MKTIVLLGGGTAGHVMPNIALLPDLLKDFGKIYYIGTKNSIEEKLITDYIKGHDVSSKLEFKTVTSQKLIRNLSPKNLTIPYSLIKGFFEARKLLKVIKPNIIFSKGGYAAVPTILACCRGRTSLRPAIIIHESDYTMGLANKICKHKATHVLTSFKETAKCKKSTHVGTAIRQELFYGKKTTSNKKTILIVGGSLGAKRINETVFELVKSNKLEKYNIIHITGKNKNNSKIKAANYTQIEFGSNPANIYNAADFVITRAGSNAIFEFLALKKPMLLIPLSKKESRGDQILNATALQKEGVCLVMQDEELSLDILFENIKSLENHQERLIKNINKSSLSKTANAEILKLIKQECL